MGIEILLHPSFDDDLHPAGSWYAMQLRQPNDLKQTSLQAGEEGPVLTTQGADTHTSCVDGC